jgi:hypothetical protein
LGKVNLIASHSLDKRMSASHFTSVWFFVMRNV